MKKLLALLLVFSLIAAFAACAKQSADPAPAETDAALPQETEAEAEAGSEAPDPEMTEAEAALTPGEYPAVTYGRITCIEAPEGWHIGDESADWRIVYVKDDESATIQLTTDEDPADKLFRRVAEQKEANGETYSTLEAVFAGVPFTVLMPDLGMPAMYGTVDGQTLVVTFAREVDIDSQVFMDIVGNAHVAPAE